MNSLTSAINKIKEYINSPLDKDMKISDKGLARLFELEGCILHIYDDRNPHEVLKRWNEHATIGVGHLISKEEWNKKWHIVSRITNENALEILEEDIVKYEDIVKKYIEVNLLKHEFDALVIRAFNCGINGFDGNKNGSGELVRMINSRNYTKKELGYSWCRLNTSGGKYLKGLEIRRLKELEIFLNNNYKDYDNKYYESRLIYNIE